MLNGVNILKLAYGANILVLVPVVYGMIAGRGVASVFEGQVEDSAGLRLLMARESEIMATMKPGQRGSRCGKGGVQGRRVPASPTNLTGCFVSPNGA